MSFALNRITKLKKISRKLVGGVAIIWNKIVQFFFWRRHTKFYNESALQNPKMHTCSNLDLKSCQVIAYDDSNLLIKVDFLLKIGFQVIVFFIPLGVGYLVIIVVNFVYKWAWQLFLGHHKIMSDWFIFLEHFSDW